MDLTTTICHEIRGSHISVVMDKASEDPVYHDHHTPRLYHFESYISVPVSAPTGASRHDLRLGPPIPPCCAAARSDQPWNRLRGCCHCRSKPKKPRSKHKRNCRKNAVPPNCVSDLSPCSAMTCAIRCLQLTSGAERLLRKYPDPPPIPSCGTFSPAADAPRS